MYKYLPLSLAIAHLKDIFVAFRVKSLFLRVPLGFPWYSKSSGLLRSLFNMTPTRPQSSLLLADLNELLRTASFCSDSIGSSLNVELVSVSLLLMLSMLLTGYVSFDN